MQIVTLSLFPQLLEQALQYSVLKRAQEKKRLELFFLNIRDFATDRRKTVDDRPFGGSPGMILKADVLHRAWLHACTLTRTTPYTILLSPQGIKLTQSLATELIDLQPLVLISGHYEGVDQRFIEAYVDLELSIGDYILTGGEFAALVTMDVLARLVPGTIKNQRSVAEDSLENGQLKYPQYTHPLLFGHREVPEILRTGHHQKIKDWQKKQRLDTTKKKRPDLL